MVEELVQRLKQIYPKRDGGHGWGVVPRLIEKAMAGGATVERIELGTANYAKHCQKKGMVGTEFVQQARTFYGPGCWWDEWADKDMRSSAEIAADNAKAALTARAARIGFRSPAAGEPAFRYEAALVEAERKAEPRPEPKFQIVR